MGCVLLGSGDYHHVTQLLLERLPSDEPIHLIVCDNHPDNMRYPFGIHCGSWVYWASKLPQVARIDVLGISSSDIGWLHAVENHWSPLYKGAALLEHPAKCIMGAFYRQKECMAKLRSTDDY